MLHPVEPAVVADLRLKTSMSAGGSALPSRTDHFQSSLTENPHQPAVLSPSSERLLPAEGLPSRTGGGDDRLIRRCIMGPSENHYESVSSCTKWRARLWVGLMVLQERTVRLKLTTLCTKENLPEGSLRHPRQPTGLSGAVLTLMQKIWEEKKRSFVFQEVRLLPQPQPCHPSAKPLLRQWKLHPEVVRMVW